MTDRNTHSDDAAPRALILLDDVWKSFGELHVLCGLNLDIRGGETAVIMGESGSGKSVILKHIIGLLKPDRGRVIFDHIEISAQDDSSLARIRERFGMVFQMAALFDSMTVRENVAFGIRRHTD